MGQGCSQCLNNKKDLRSIDIYHKGSRSTTLRENGLEAKMNDDGQQAMLNTSDKVVMKSLIKEEEKKNMKDPINDILKSSTLKKESPKLPPISERLPSDEVSRYNTINTVPAVDEVVKMSHHSSMNDNVQNLQKKASDKNLSLEKKKSAQDANKINQSNEKQFKFDKQKETAHSDLRKSINASSRDDDGESDSVEVERLENNSQKFASSVYSETSIKRAENEDDVSFTEDFQRVNRGSDSSSGTQMFKGRERGLTGASQASGFSDTSFNRIGDDFSNQSHNETVMMRGRGMTGSSGVSEAEFRRIEEDDDEEDNIIAKKQQNGGKFNNNLLKVGESNINNRNSQQYEEKDDAMRFSQENESHLKGGQSMTHSDFEQRLGNANNFNYQENNSFISEDRGSSHYNKNGQNVNDEIERGGSLAQSHDSDNILMKKQATNKANLNYSNDNDDSFQNDLGRSKKESNALGGFGEQDEDSDTDSATAGTKRKAKALY